MQSKCLCYTFVTVFWLSPLHFFLNITKKMFSKHHKSLLHLNLTSECFQTSSSHHSPNLDNSTLLVCQTINSSLISIIRFYILHLILHSSVRCFQRRLNGGQRPALIHACSLQYPSTQVPSQQTTAASMLPTPLLLLSRDASIRGSLLPILHIFQGIFVNSSQPAVLILKSCHWLCNWFGVRPQSSLWH